MAQRKAAGARVPTEAQEQAVVAQWLRMRPSLLWTHVGHGELRNIVVARRLRTAGLAPGVPDLLIFDRPPRAPADAPQAVGVAIEMKRTKGGRVSPEQTAWLDGLRQRGWLCYVCKGADAAIDQLQRLGY